MKRILGIGAALFCLLAIGQTAYAHVLIPDSTGSKGLIVHIMPDDDPIAGQSSTLYIDVQDVSSVSSINLRITDQENKSVDVPVKTEASLSSAEYQFPQQGVYRLIVTVKTAEKTYRFMHSQRVSRGSELTSYQYPAWAEILLIATGILLIVLVILGVNNRHDIKKHSQF